MTSDADLLRAYNRTGSDAAFEEFVRRHIDRVYATALRRVAGDIHLAKEVTQHVFLAAAQNSRRLADHPVPHAWLFVCARNAAANVLRGQRRRELNENKVAAMQTEPSSRDAESIEEIRDAIDAALDTLSEVDRQVVILRYFEGHSYAAIADTLAIKEDAARMRADRALQRIRTRMQRAGVMSSAALISTAMSAPVIGSAPPGLTASVTAAVTAKLTGTASGLSVLMSIPKTTAIALGVGVASLTAFLIVRRSPESQPSLHVDAALPTTPPAPNSQQPLASLVGRQADQRAALNAPMGSEDKIAALKDLLARLPEQGIPELKLATNGDWHSAVDGPLETTDDYRRALSKLRASAENRFAKIAQAALMQYMKAHDGEFPADPAHLQAFMPDSAAGELLARYRIAPASDIPNVRVGGDRILTQRQVVDSMFDQYIVVGPNGFGSTTVSPALAHDLAMARPAMQAYKQANGERHRDLKDVIPYATTVEQKEALQRILDRETRTSGP